MKQNLAATLSLSAISALSSSAAESPAPPNIVFIITDDQSFDTIGAYNGKALTPHMDRLAKEGIRFTRAYCSTPMCTPSRYTCLTGEYAGRCSHSRYTGRHPLGTIGRVFNSCIELEKNQPNMAAILRDSGYATGMVGKWHLGEWIHGSWRGKKWVPHPGWEKMGFKHYPKKGDPTDPEIIAAMRHNQKEMQRELKEYGFEDSAGVYWSNLLEMENETLSKTHNMEWMTQGALNFIEKNRENPFFLYFSTTLHHGPKPQKSLEEDANPLASGEGILAQPVTGVQAPRETLKQRVTKAGFDENTAYCTWLDDGIGAILNKLDELKLAENTLVILFGDNGYYGKASLYEFGVRTPCIMRWPGRIAPGQTRDDLIQNIDFAPTMLDICSITPPKKMTVDGTSLAPLFSGKKIDWREALYFEYGYSRAVCTKEWKYITVRYPDEIMKALESGERKEPPVIGHIRSLDRLIRKRNENYYSFDQLYNLSTEKQSEHWDTLNEQKNLAEEPKHAGTLRQMKKRMSGFLNTFPDRPYAEFTSE